jgi:hypothetical protein
MRIQLGSPAQNHFQITLTMLSVNRILHVPGAHAHITPAPQPHYGCVRSVLPAYLQRCYEWLGHSELLILPRFQTSRSATSALIHDPPVTQTRPAGLRECGRNLWSSLRRSHAHVSAVQQHNCKIFWRKQVHSRGRLTTQKISRSASNIFAPPFPYSNARPARKDGAEFPHPPRTGSPTSTEHTDHP